MTLKKIAVALALLATASSAAFAQTYGHRGYQHRGPERPLYNYAPGYGAPSYGGGPSYSTGAVGGGSAGDMGIGSQR